MLGRRRTWDVAWFTHVAGDRQHGVDARRRHRAGLRGRPVPVRRTAAVARAPHRGVRAADGRDGRRVLGTAPRFARSQHLGDPRCPRGVQPGGRRAHRRRRLGAPAARPRGGGGDARSVAVAGPPRGHPSPAATGTHRGRRHRVPVHVHVVRRHPDPRNGRPPDVGGRDLAAGDAARRDRPGGRARPRPARRPRRRRRLVDVQPAPPQPRHRDAAAHRDTHGAAAWAPASRARPRRCDRDRDRGGRDDPAPRPRRAFDAVRRRLLAAGVADPRRRRGPPRHQRQRRPARQPADVRSRPRRGPPRSRS